MDNLLYELKPVGLLLIGCWAAWSGQNAVMTGSGVLLIFATGSILATRLKHRRIL